MELPPFATPCKTWFSVKGKKKAQTLPLLQAHSCGGGNGRLSKIVCDSERTAIEDVMMKTPPSGFSLKVGMASRNSASCPFTLVDQH